MTGTQADSATRDGSRKISRWVQEELGILDLYHAGGDVHILNAMRFTRMFGYGAIALNLAQYLSALDFSDPQIGLFMSLVLAGDVLLTLVTSLLADRVGRRATLAAWSAVMLASGVVFALSRDFYVLLVAAMLGVISTSGNEVGPFRGVEESILADLVEPDKRTAIFNGYVIIAMLGTAVGLPVSGALTDTLRNKHHWRAEDAYRCIFWLYAALGALNVVLSCLLSKRCERATEGAITTPQGDAEDADERRPLLATEGQSTPPASRAAGTDSSDAVADTTPAAQALPNTPHPPASISPSSRPIVALLILLFSIDSFASGMIPYSITNYYIQLKYPALSSTALGAAMSGAQLLSIPFTALATPLARRLGHVRAMAAAHLPAALFLALTPLPASLAGTLAAVYARAAFNGMDQAPRSAFVAAVVRPRDRTAVNGLAMICKTFATAWGPSITGVLMGDGRFWLAFVLAGAVKAGYDVGLLVCFDVCKLHRRGAEKEPGHEANGGNEQIE